MPCCKKHFSTQPCTSFKTQQTGVEFRLRYLGGCPGNSSSSDSPDDDASGGAGSAAAVGCLAESRESSYGTYGSPGVGFTNYNTLVSRRGGQWLRFI